MKYYLLSHTLDLKIIGAFPQIQTFIKDYDSDRVESCSKIGRYYCGQIPEKRIDFDGLELAKKARLTDYTIAAYLNDLCGLLVSQDLYNYLKELHMVDYITYDAKIYQKNSHEAFATYKWIHYTRNYPEMIDYKKSHLYEDHHNPTYRKLPVGSYEEYLSMREKVNYVIKPVRLVLRKEMAGQYDVLRVGVIKSETYVIEAVKKRIEMSFTGIEFKPADYLVVE